jgi:hypothetical protein
LVKQAQGTPLNVPRSLSSLRSHIGMNWNVTEPVVTAKGIADSVNLTQLDANPGPEVPVVNEFSDVLHDEFPVMPPDRDIKFVIELVFGTAPMYKRPYRIAAKQLAKLKDQIEELPEKG